MKKLLLLGLISLLIMSSISTAFADTYVVQSGDVLWKIARDNNTTVSELTKLNNLDNANLIYANQVLKITDMNDVTVESVTFESEGKILAGNLYYPPNYDASATYPGIIVTGSWTTVKEQMASIYAEGLAQEGFITLAYDPRGFGESEGDIRNYESPEMKIEDIKSAVDYFISLDAVDHIGAFGVCAGASYTLVAASEDSRIEAVATAATWIHDEEAVKLFYGGEEGVAEKISAAQEAKALFESTGEITYIKKISTTDPTAAMYGPYDYYLNPERGGIPEWEPDYFAVMTWEEWLTYNPRSSAQNLEVPTLMIHSDGAVLPEYAKVYFNEIKTSDKKLIWLGTDILPSPFHQFSFYDQDAEVSLSINESAQWFNEKLND